MDGREDQLRNHIRRKNIYHTEYVEKERILVHGTGLLVLVHGTGLEYSYNLLGSTIPDIEPIYNRRLEPCLSSRFDVVIRLLVCNPAW